MLNDYFLDTKYNALFIFVFGILSFGFILTTSLSVTFLITDRFLTVLTTKYTYKVREKLAVINVTCQVMLYIIFVFTQVFQADIPEIDEYASKLL